VKVNRIAGAVQWEIKEEAAGARRARNDGS
jgi:hypothetical protein